MQNNEIYVIALASGKKTPSSIRIPYRGMEISLSTQAPAQTVVFASEESTEQLFASGDYRNGN